MLFYVQGPKYCVVHGKLTIGENSVIAANAVLLNSVPENEVWGGIPARKIGDVKINKNFKEK